MYVQNFKIPANCPKPVIYKNHQCSHMCMLWVHYNFNKTKYMNVLSIPLHFGFLRSLIKDKKTKLQKVIYTTPCGSQIIDEHRMYNYLKVTAYDRNQMTIDLFNFDCTVDPLSSFIVPIEYIRLHDISYNMEFKTISVVNRFNDLLPKHFNYITDYKTTPGVRLNKDIKFLCGCDCTDNCEDKTKCACWKLTCESQKNYPNIFNDPNIGYRYKRLYSPVCTGIFECNETCKCSKTCLNRVVQEPLKASLQLFLTEKKGWGVRTLADIPKGSFVCTIIGEILTEKDAQINASNGDNYQADLDFINVAEEIKKGFESDVVQTEVETENHSSSSDDEEFNPSWAIKRKMTVAESSRMSLRKKVQRTNAKNNSKHKVSKPNTHKRGERKSLLRFLDKDCNLCVLDANANGNIGRYINHSCDPNLFIQNVFIDTHDLRFPYVAYFASSNIRAGTELECNYNYTIGSVQNRTLDCHCGSNLCKGKLL